MLLITSFSSGDKTTKKLQKFDFNVLNVFTREKTAELFAYRHNRGNLLNP